ncbi:MAG: hypothetical protein LC772_12070, partial [Chloroflexi bacterium]|nr:hypothetical protein [Chloroflexota bacterium]
TELNVSRFYPGSMAAQLLKTLAVAGALSCAALLPFPADAATPQSLLPASGSVNGWKMVGAPVTYNGDTLYQLIDGGADAVKQYAFSTVANASYKPGGRGNQVITIAVYDMTDPLDAFGRFSDERLGARPLVLGAGGARNSDGTAVFFWKSRYVVEISSTSRAALFSAAMMNFGRLIAARIPGSSAMPAIFRSLPAGYSPLTLRYVRSNAEARSFLSNAVTARYPSLGPTAELFIATYPSSGAAAGAYTRYLAAERRNRGLALLRGVGQAAFAVLDTFQRNVVVAQKGNHLVGVVKSASMPGAQNLVRLAVSRVH